MGVERASSTVRVSPTSTVAVLTTVELSAALTYNLLCGKDVHHRIHVFTPLNYFWFQLLIQAEAW